MTYDELPALSRAIVLALKPKAADEELVILLVASLIQVAQARSFVNVVKPKLTVIEGGKSV